MKKYLFSLSAIAVFAAGAAQAQTVGSFTVRLGATTIRPAVSSGDLSAPSPAGTKVDINNSSQVTGGIFYMLTENIAIDVPVGIPFKHEVLGAGAIDGTGKLSDVKALPITVTAQYRFGAPTSMFRPFVGAGVTYAVFSDTKATSVLSGITGGLPSNPTTMSMKNSFGPTVQLGLDMKLFDRWSLNVSATKVMLKTTGSLSTGQTIEVELNPMAYSFGVGYTF
ncbi:MULTISPECIES: OmpW/AlkL family protein [Roseateles]|uniref:Outer membrane beta-barrel protein n=1 Tax=Roseateles albus TaxID=2987525 RepID=A0ABT5KDX9_9BURK|nr:MULTISPECIES: OmpW family outer membrane protein [Roseateles]MCV2358535.1 outer membrane beta-barrel protein [Paucibacter sp. TC2R-5]MDC8772136.1 outer membrane beta-barrel protein [Roseateles albus]